MTESVSKRLLLAACDEAEKASDDVLARSDLWLAMHPFKHRRLRRRLHAARTRMRVARAAWDAEGRPA